MYKRYYFKYYISRNFYIVYEKERENGLHKKNIKHKNVVISRVRLISRARYFCNSAQHIYIFPRWNITPRISHS